MAYCDVCGNFDDSHYDDLLETYQDIDRDAHQPDLYYYWHGDIQEDYQMPAGYECLCERCFGDLLGAGKIIEKYEWKTNKLNPSWNDAEMGWFVPLE